MHVDHNHVSRIKNIVEKDIRLFDLAPLLPIHAITVVEKFK